MRKVAENVEADVIALINAGTLDTTITGGVYASGQRPFNSKAEDIVVSFLTGLDGQKQVGIVNINAYVPDILSAGKRLVKNTARCAVIANELNVFKKLIMTSNLALSRSGYKFLPDGDMIQTFEEPEINQHFVNLRLKFEYLTV
jgi:hypothetical protein